MVNLATYVLLAPNKVSVFPSTVKEVAEPKALETSNYDGVCSGQAISVPKNGLNVTLFPLTV